MRMYRVTRSYFIFFALIIFVIQNAEAISFATDYKISINGQHIGNLKRSINSEGHISIEIHFMTVSGAQASTGIELVQMMTSGQIPSLQSIFHHLQLVLSGSSLASASPIQNNGISMTLIESASQQNSISYNFLGQTCHYSEADQPDDLDFLIGQSIYCSDTSGDLNVQPISQLTPSTEDDEGIEQITTIQDKHIESIGSLVTASLSDAHGEEVTGSFFLFGQYFEQLLTTLIEGQSHNSGLLHLQSIFPIFVPLPGQNSFQVVPTGYGQELIYNSGSNMFTQQDPANDPNPCGVTTSYQLNSNGIISSIAIHDGESEVTFSSEQITQTSNSSITSLPNPAPAILNLWLFPNWLFPNFSG